MKNFKENAMMQEMNLQEMKEVDGGSITGVFIWALSSLAWSVCEDPKSAKDNFCKGMSDVLNM